MFTLRPYQKDAIDMTWEWMRENDGNPCLVLHTAAGKSIIVAELCKDAMKFDPNVGILMLSHNKEIIRQNASKLRTQWPNAPLGIYSAGLRQKDIDQITFGGIQSVINVAHKLGKIDLIFVDECHLINHRQDGAYRRLIAFLSGINPDLRVIGLTATPYRLGHGCITDGDAIFDDLIEPVTIEALISGGFISPLRSKSTSTKIDTASVKVKGGEFVEKDLQAIVDRQDQNLRIANEVVSRAGDRSKWLLFCTGIDHSNHMAEAVESLGVSCAVVTGKTPSGERDRILKAHEKGDIICLSNANVLTTGYDSPNIDLIGMVRPTMSPSLYVQSVGRGMRLKDHTDHCLVLDFAGNVAKHGPITDIIPPAMAGGGGEAPVKLCPECSEILHLSCMVCPECKYIFPKEDKLAQLKIHNDDIMGVEIIDTDIKRWKWRIHTKKKTGQRMLKCEYFESLGSEPIVEYLTVMHEGNGGRYAIRTLKYIASRSGADIAAENTLEGLCDVLNKSTPPDIVSHKRDGKYQRVINRIWKNDAPF